MSGPVQALCYFRRHYCHISSEKFLELECYPDHHRHQSCLTSWGRSALQLQRSMAMSRATSAEVLVSISTCRTQVCLGRPGRRFQCELLSQQPPAHVLTGASSGS